MKLLNLKQLKGAFLSGDLTLVLTRYSDLLLALLVIVIVGMMIIPLPTWLLDILLTINITIGVVLLLISLYIPQALNIASFPTILLITTLYRLALNVSTTRLILLYADAGTVVASFGQFVVKGNYVVGFVIFLILVIINFLVISKGSERVSEVSARFVLDAMPGKQMSIDSDLRAGAFDLAEARRRRTSLQRESQLYGAMDGAMKFVKGDSIAGIIITIINIVGGIIIGVFMMDLTIVEALQTFTLLTIGDGLVSQIPALLISTTSGIIVTRVASEEEDSNLGRDIGTQLLAHPKAISIASGMLVAMALIPGLPFKPFIILALFTGSLGYSLFKTKSLKESEKEEQEEKQETTESFFQPFSTPVAMDVGKGLSQYLDPRDKGVKFDAELLPMMIQYFYFDIGVKLPYPQIRLYDPYVEPFSLTIRINEIPVTEFSFIDKHYLVGESSENLRTLKFEGIPALNPSTKAPASFVSEDKIELMKSLFPVWGPDEFTILCLEGVLRNKAAEFLGIQEVQGMLDQMQNSFPALIKNTIPKIINIDKLTEILKRLVAESISIRDLRIILEAIIKHGKGEEDTGRLTEAIRSEMKNYLTYKYKKGGPSLVVFLIAPEMEEAIKNSIKYTSKGGFLTLDNETMTAFLKGVQKVIENIPPAAPKPAILASPETRRFVRLLVSFDFPDIPVISINDIVPDTQIQPISYIKPVY